MSAVVWIVTVLLAVVFLTCGVTKLSRDRERLHAGGLTWVEDVDEVVLRALGAVEVLGALGLVLPGLTRIALFLVPLAALGLAAIMVLAMALHVRRNEYSRLGVNLVLLALAMFVAFGRLGPAPFGS